MQIPSEVLLPVVQLMVQVTSLFQVMTAVPS
jgi:hypothetical protein